LRRRSCVELCDLGCNGDDQLADELEVMLAADARNQSAQGVGLLIGPVARTQRTVNSR
jgi:hypothetical protein